MLSTRFACLKDWSVILTDNAANVVKVLMLPYIPAQFLINRSQCSSSIFINDSRPRSDISLWLREDLVSGDLSLPLFDLDRFLSACFHVKSPGAAHLALIRTWDSFAPDVQVRFLERGLEDGSPLAFRVSSGTVMADMTAEEFSLSPAVVQAHLCRKGITALALPHEEGMRYLIDLDILLADCLLGGCDEYSAG